MCQNVTFISQALIESRFCGSLQVATKFIASLMFLYSEHVH